MTATTRHRTFIRMPPVIITDSEASPSRRAMHFTKRTPTLPFRSPIIACNKSSRIPPDTLQPETLTPTVSYVCRYRGGVSPAPPEGEIAYRDPLYRCRHGPKTREGSHAANK